MTPKEKAQELIDKMKRPLNDDYFVDYNPYYKECALIAVDEIIKSNPLEPNDTPEWLQPEDWFSDSNISAEKYWLEVKKEITNL